MRATAFATITSHPEITGVTEILTMQLGPASVPELTQVFLDPSEVTTDDLHRTRQRERQILDDIDPPGTYSDPKHPAE